MSGLETVSFLFGVLPVLIEVVKGYARLSDRIYTFRHYSREVKSIQGQFQIKKHAFINECRWLLRLVVDNNQKVEVMLENPSDKGWYSEELNDKMNDRLKEDSKWCESILKGSKITLEDLEADLKKFDILAEQKSKDESLREAICRLRRSVKVSLDKPKYEKALSDLQDRNSQLWQLRSHLRDFQNQRTCSPDVCVARKTLPSKIIAIQKASQKLYEALSNAWCCGDLTHAEHFAKICLDAKVEAGVNLDLAILYQGREFDEDERYLAWLVLRFRIPDSCGLHIACWLSEANHTYSEATPEPPIWLYVQSTSIETITNNVTPSNTTTSYTTGEANLCQTENICNYLKQNLHLCRSTLTKHCVGYLETPNFFKHTFYMKEKRNTAGDRPSDVPCNTIFSIPDLMTQSVDETLTVVDQLKLAHKTAVAILQFNATPWLTQRWRLHDLSYFGMRNKFNDEALRTLHLSAQISDYRHMPQVVPMEGVETDTTPFYTFSEEEHLGINNSTLFSLGVALLELGHWKPLESLSCEQDPNPVMTARRLAARQTPLGPKYQEIARKCLQCSFRSGTDLSKDELRAEVYGDVVCQLESMIESLSK